MNYMIRVITFVIFFATTNVASAKDQTPETFVKNVAHSIISIVTSNTTSDAQKKASIKALINKSFDVPWMSKFVLGRNYKALSSTDQQEYKRLYLSYLVGNYFPILMKYDKDKFYIKHTNKVSKDSYDVDTIIDRSDKPTVSVKYHIKEFDSSFKAVDMIVEGISTIISQRSEFESIIQNDGIHGFMKKMKERYS